MKKNNTTWEEEYQKWKEEELIKALRKKEKVLFKDPEYKIFRMLKELSIAYRSSSGREKEEIEKAIEKLFSRELGENLYLLHDIEYEGNRVVVVTAYVTYYVRIYPRLSYMLEITKVYNDL